MQPIRYSINVTLDGCCDHQAVIPSRALHEHVIENFRQLDGLLFGRVTYQMMEEGWRGPLPKDWPAWMEDFRQAINPLRKYVVSSTLKAVDWNSELLQGDLAESVQRLKQQPGRGLGLGGLTLPRALAELGLIDEYELISHPRVAGHGPTLFAGLVKPLDLQLVSRQEIGDGIVSVRYLPRG
jgi:dihydrofolate reductase